ncbi:hypothetical protein M3J09_001981 [Ascochyta lentis]
MRGMQGWLTHGRWTNFNFFRGSCGLVVLWVRGKWVWGLEFRDGVNGVRKSVPPALRFCQVGKRVG